MSSEEIIDVQPTEHKENGETEAPAAIPQEQQQVHEEAKEVEGMSTSICEDVQESMDTGSAHQEGGPATPMEDSTCADNDQSHVADTSAPISEGDGDGDGDATPVESSDDIPYDTTKIFVGGLSWETKDETLKKYFEKYGTVSEVKIKLDANTKRSRGFAFVVFENPEAVEEVMKNIPHTIDKRTVDAKRAIPHAIHQALKNRTKKIFVGGVPVDMPEETIREYFVQFGEIDEVALVTDKVTKKRRGFVFVTYVSEDSVDKCTEQTFHTVKDTQVEVKRATPRDQSPNTQGGRGRGGRGQGGYGGRTQWAPYGQHFGGYGGYQGGYHGGYHPYGGYGFPPPYGPYGGGPYGPPGYDQGVGGSRYGPMKQNHSGGSYHPYSR